MRRLGLVLLLAACGQSSTATPPPDDPRKPELGSDVGVVRHSKIALGQALDRAGASIEAKFELDDAGQLSLSVYPLGKSADLDAERNVFQELAGDPTAATWSPALETFSDREHLLRSARDLTLIQLSQRGLRETVAQAERDGRVYWTVPTLHAGRAGYGIYVLDDGDGDEDSTAYRFIDGGGSTASGMVDLGVGPGSGASDARVPELGDDMGVVTSSRIRLSDALRMVEAAHGPVIEAKFELDDSGKLSLSIYPVGSDIATDPEHNTFFEVAGDPTATAFTPETAAFADDDAEHLLRSSRDLTIVQAASLGLVDAVTRAEAQLPGGIVFWAIPTIRETRAGYGIYVLAPDHTVHYLFVS
jgi:hypothetical protein